MDIQKQIEYWEKSSGEDFSAAEALLEKGYIRHSLFFAHLSLEKMLKAHVTKQTNNIPPRIHNLIRLTEISEISIDEERKAFLRECGVYQLEGRYPDSEQIELDVDFTKKELGKAKEMLEWLKNQL